MLFCHHHTLWPEAHPNTHTWCGVWDQTSEIPLTGWLERELGKRLDRKRRSPPTLVPAPPCGPQRSRTEGPSPAGRERFGCPCSATWLVQSCAFAWLFVRVGTNGECTITTHLSVPVPVLKKILVSYLVVYCLHREVLSEMRTNWNKPHKWLMGNALHSATPYFMKIVYL